MPAKRKTTKKENAGGAKTRSGRAPVRRQYTYDELGRLLTVRAVISGGSASNAGKARSGRRSTLDDDGNVISRTVWKYYGLMPRQAGEPRKNRRQHQ